MLKVRNQNGDWQDVECFVKDGTFKKCDPFYFDGEKWVGVGSPAVDYSQGAYLSIFDDPSTTLMAHFISTKATATCQIKTGAGAWQNVSMLKAVPFTGTDKNVLWFELDALTPATEYEMRLQGEERTYYFTTIDPDEDIKVAVISDQANDLTAFETDLPLGFALMQAQGADILAIAGDAVHDDGHRFAAWETFWKGYFEGTKDRLIPIVATLGNHDGRVPLSGGGYGNLLVGSGATPAHAFYSKGFFANLEKEYGLIDIRDDFSILFLNSGHTVQISGGQTAFIANTLVGDASGDATARAALVATINSTPISGDGRNLFLWANAATTNQKGVLYPDFGTFDGATYTNNRTSSSSACCVTIPNNRIVAGQPITVSFDVLAPTAQQIYFGVFSTADVRTRTGTAVTANTLTHMEMTVTPPAGATYRQQIILQGNTGTNPTAANIKFTNIKLEYGTLATTFSIAPEEALVEFDIAHPTRESLLAAIAAPSVAGDGKNLFKWKEAELVDGNGVPTPTLGGFDNGVFTLQRSQYNGSIWIVLPGSFVTPNVSLTLSCDVTAPVAQQIGFGVSNTAGTTTTKREAIEANTVTHLELTVTPPSGFTYLQQIRLQGDTTTNPNNANTVFSNIKLELGAVATPWSDVPEYALATLDGRRDGKNVLPLFHVPPVGGWYANTGTYTPSIIDNWAPIFKDTGVKFAANGHEHVNLVTKPINRVSAGVMGPVAGGVVYVQGMTMGNVTRGINNYYANCVEFIENTHKAIYFLNYKKSGTAKLDMIAFDGTVLYTLER